MSCLGVHFALTDEQSARLLAAASEGDPALDAFRYELLQAWDQEWLVSTDKAWDAIHRCLTDGRLDHGDTPFHKCVLGRSNLYCGRNYIINYLDPNEVAEVATAIGDIDRDRLRRGYDGFDPESYYFLVRSDDDFEYTWHYFTELRNFFRKAAAARRAVVFAVDQ